MNEISNLASYALLLPVVGLLWLFYRFFIKIYIDAWRYKQMDPTLKVFVSPMAGLPQVQKQCLRKYGDSHWFVKDMMRNNPDQKAYLSNLGDQSFLIITDAELVKQMSLQYKNYEKFKIFKHMDQSYLRSIFFAEGGEWKMQRSLIGHAFNHDQLERMIPIMMTTTKESLRRRVNELPQNDVCAVLNETQTIIGEILVRTFFSNEITQKQVNGKNLSLALADFTSNNFYQSRNPVNLLTILLFGTKARQINFVKSDKDLQNTQIEIRKVIFGIINDRIAGKDREQNDFMNIYINEMTKREEQLKKAVEEGSDASKIQRITKQDILQQLMSFYFAGIDTTGHLLSFALYSAAQYPNFCAKLEEEINSIIKVEEDLTYDNIKKLDYTEKFLKECLRMWPPAVGILTRVVTKDHQLGPFKLKKDSLIGTNILGLMHNPKYYKNPEIFDPERWSDKQSLSSESYSYIPFSAGPRSCIGKHMAMMEAKVILIYFLKYFKLTRTEVPLRVHCIFLYEPFDEKLVRLTKKEQNNWV